MEKRFSICWPELGKEIEARLLDVQDPDLCAEFWGALPFRSIQSHAVVAGFQMYCPFRLMGRARKLFQEPMNRQPPGRINIELDFQYLAVNYGPMTEPVPAVPIAQVAERCLEDLKVVGRMAWDNLLFSDAFVTVLFDRGKGAA